jgi:TPR repeat protein
LVLLACVGDGEATEAPATESLKTLEKRANRGDAAAEYALGKIFVEGRGVRFNEVQAARWYRKAAERGYAAAENALGFSLR